MENDTWKTTSVMWSTSKKIVGFYGYYHLLINNNNNKTAYNLQNKAREQIGLTFNIIFNFFILSHAL